MTDHTALTTSAILLSILARFFSHIGFMKYMSRGNAENAFLNGWPFLSGL